MNILARRLFIMRGFLLVLVVGFACAATDWSEVERVIQNGINDGVFTGGVLGIATNNATLYKKAFGTLGPKRGFYAPPVTLDMKFDIGYLTEVIGINSVVMELYDQTKLLLTNKISYFLFDFDNNNKRYITVQNILEHNSGLQATYTAAYPKTPAELIKAIYNLKLEYTTETKTQFSEIGPVVLGQVIMKVKNSSLADAFFQIMTIAGLRDTTYLPKTNRDKIVPGGYTDKVAWGSPFNRMAHFLNDSAGNAGLFSTLDNVITYMQIMLNRGKLPGFSRVFSEEIVDKVLNVTTYSKYKNTRALGWETVPATNPPCGKKFSPSPNSFGLADVSASYVWADKKKNITIVFLANGAFPARTTLDPSAWQGTLSDAVMTALGH